MEEDKCKLCGSEDRDLRSDFLREVYFFKPSDKFDKALFVPRLNYSEKYQLIRGSNFVCHNRSMCRKRASKLVKLNKQY